MMLQSRPALPAVHLPHVAVFYGLECLFADLFVALGALEGDGVDGSAATQGTIEVLPRPLLNTQQVVLVPTAESSIDATRQTYRTHLLLLRNTRRAGLFLLRPGADEDSDGFDCDGQLLLRG